MTKPTMQPNVCWFSYDVNNRIKITKELVKIIELSKKSKGILIKEIVGFVGDVIIIAYPADCKFKKMNENLQEVLGHADKIHLTKEGKFFFTFKADSGMPACDFWLDEKQAHTWVLGVMASDELMAVKNGGKYLNSPAGAADKAQYIKEKQAALDLLDKC